MSEHKYLFAIFALVAFLLAPVSSIDAANVASGGRDSSSWCGTWNWGIEVSLARHELNKRRLSRGFTVQSASSSAASTSAFKVQAEGKVAVIEDNGTVVISRNQFDFDKKGVKYIRKGKAGFKVKNAGGSVSSSLGDKIQLSDDDSVRVDLPFKIRFFGKSYDSFFVNSDGNITFRKSDSASTARDVRRMVSGPPRIAPLFADLDPASASGEGGVYVRTSESKVTVTWWQVPNFDSNNLNTFEVEVNPRGNVEFQFDNVDSAEGVVGVAPGGGSGLELVDLSSDLPMKRKGIAIAEQFSKSTSVDEAGVAEIFLDNFGDNFDQIVLFTDFPYLLNEAGTTIAYHMTIRNPVRGIGSAVYNASRFYGSNGRLQGFINMGYQKRYPNNLNKPTFFGGLYSPIDILAHEIGHQWLVGARFIDDNGQVNDSLLGRASAHWSYYFNSEQSFLEGNLIQDNGDGSFTTQAGDPTYNDLDLYLMGLLPKSKVSGFWYVEPNNSKDTDTAAPEAGASFSGTRVDLTIQDVIDALGPRRPSAADAPKQFRIGFVLLTKNGKKAPSSSVNKVKQFATDIEQLFSRETDRLGSIQAGL